MQKAYRYLLGLILVLFSVSPAFAQTTSPSVTRQQQRITTLHTNCDNAISQRLISLNNDLTRINGLVKLSSDQKTQFVGNIQTDISGLSALKTKCDGDADLTTLRSDYQSVFTQYRIYAVFLPQTNLLVASDTMDVTADKLSDLAGILQTRIQNAGNSSTLTTLLTDMQNKIADAKIQYGNAQSLISSITPASYNSNPSGTKSTVQSARSDIKAGASDLQGALSDAKQIRQGLK